MTGLLSALSGLSAFTNADNPSPQTLSPLIAGMLGAAGGAGQYAGASRLPITNGQVIGGAAGGFLKGYQSGLADIQQTQQSQMLGAQLGLLRQTPAFIRQALGMMGGAAPAYQPPVPGSAAAAPRTFGAASAAPSGPVALQQAAAAGGRPGPTPYAASIQNSMTSGNPGASAIPPAGGAQGAPGVALGAQPPIAAQPLAAPPGIAQAASSGAPQAPAQADPQAALRRAQAMDIMGGLIPQLAGVGKAGELGVKYDPGIAANMAAAKANVSSPLSVDLANYHQAVTAGDQNAAAMWATKAKYDSDQLHTASWSGTTTRTGPNGEVQYYMNPTTGTYFQNGQESLIPGAAAVKNQLAFAEGSGEAGGKTSATPFKTQITSGPLAGQTNLTLGRNLFPGLGALGGAGVGLNANAGAPHGPLPGVQGGVVASVAPVTEEMSKAAGEQAGKNNEDFQTEAELAKDQNTQIDAIRNAAATFGPGKFANVRGEWLNLLNSSGLISKDQMQQLGSYQEGAKIGIQLQAAATRVLGAREAAQVFTWMGKSMPNLTMSSAGLEKVSAFMEGMNNYKIARAQMAQQHFNQNDAVGVNNVRNAFLQNSNPMYFIMAASSPADRVEYLKNMGPAKAKQFLSSWAKSEQGGYAPGPQ